MKQTTLLLNTLESRELKKKGMSTVKRGNIELTLLWNKEEKQARIVSSKAVEGCKVVMRDNETIFLTGEQTKALKEYGNIGIEYHECDYNINLIDGVAYAEPVNHYTSVYVR